MIVKRFVSSGVMHDFGVGVLLQNHMMTSPVDLGTKIVRPVAMAASV